MRTVWRGFRMTGEETRDRTLAGELALEAAVPGKAAV
jgi:hypothetical protein